MAPVQVRDSLYDCIVGGLSLSTRLIKSTTRIQENDGIVHMKVSNVIQHWPQLQYSILDMETFLAHLVCAMMLFGAGSDGNDVHCDQAALAFRPQMDPITIC